MKKATGVQELNAQNKWTEEMNKMVLVYNGCTYLLPERKNCKQVWYGMVASMIAAAFLFLRIYTLQI